jgi:hypothetical protein
MAKRRRNKRTAESAGDGGWLRRYPAVWLATISTVVGLATGMFTLRDQIFPREAGTAAAVSTPAFQQSVGEVCDELNANDKARAREDRATARQLKNARATVGQRNVLVDGARRITARTEHALAAFKALEPPEPLRGVRRATAAAWDRYVARLRDYALALDEVGTRAQLVGALEQLASAQPAFGRDSDAIRSGLVRLGGANCDLEPRTVTTTYTLPPAKGTGRPANRPPSPAPTAKPPPAATVAPPSNTPESTSPTNPGPPANPPPMPNVPPSVPPANPPGPPAGPIGPDG